jgi:exopolysaccharide production protein ExoZ
VRQKTLLTVQALRAVAAASIVIHHVLVMLSHNGGYSFAYSGNWSAGVDLFFLISGFVMIYAHADDFGIKGAPLAFAGRRIIRIAPLYWIATSAIVLLLITAPQMFTSTKLDWSNVLCSYAFLLSPNSIGEVGTVTQTGWTLCFEAYFYLVFAALLMLPRKYFLVSGGAIFGAGLAVGLSGTAIAPWATVAVRPLVLEFYLGAVVAVLFLRGHSLPMTAATLAIILGIAGVALMTPGNDWTRVLIWGSGCTLILAGAVSLERCGIRVPKILVALGASSYSLYLVHPFVLPTIGKAWNAAGLSNLPATALGLIAFLIALLIAHLVYLWVEKPMTKWLKNFGPAAIRPRGAAVH